MASVPTNFAKKINEHHSENTKSTMLQTAKRVVGHLVKNIKMKDVGCEATDNAM